MHALGDHDGAESFDNVSVVDEDETAAAVVEFRIEGDESASDATELDDQQDNSNSVAPSVVRDDPTSSPAGASPSASALPNSWSGTDGDKPRTTDPRLLVASASKGDASRSGGAGGKADVDADLNLIRGYVNSPAVTTTNESAADDDDDAALRRTSSQRARTQAATLLQSVARGVAGRRAVAYRRTVLERVNGGAGVEELELASERVQGRTFGAGMIKQRAKKKYVASPFKNLKPRAPRTNTLPFFPSPPLPSPLTQSSIRS